MASGNTKLILMWPSQREDEEVTSLILSIYEEHAGCDFKNIESHNYKDGKVLFSGFTDSDSGLQDDKFVAENQNFSDAYGGNLIESSILKLNSNMHHSFFMRALDKGLPQGFVSLDASRPWLIYWCLRGLALLHRLKDVDFTIELDKSNEINYDRNDDSDDPESIDLLMSQELRLRCIATLEACIYSSPKNPTQKFGFGGGPGQLPHAACTFVAVSCFKMFGLSSEGFGVANFLQSVLVRYDDLEGKFVDLSLSITSKDDPVSFPVLQTESSENRNIKAFRTHVDGEVDVRGTYCAIAALKVCGELSLFKDHAQGLLLFLLSTQSKLDGGFGALPMTEAHAGYTYCALAAIFILTKEFDFLCPIVWKNLDWRGITGFGGNLQCHRTGGLRGRSNKLVDACYSFWAGAIHILCKSLYLNYCRTLSFQPALDQPGHQSIMAYIDAANSAINKKALMQYILVACQDFENGGIRDKPGKRPDLYHTCYGLAGLLLLCPDRCFGFDISLNLP